MPLPNCEAFEDISEKMCHYMLKKKNTFAKSAGGE